ncbi:hypothetical protein PUATCC27989T_02537 [Phytobacter ursingii]|nr:hypothetical protein PUATCC27989T_02537 [Phytobacter ursingii]
MVYGAYMGHFGFMKFAKIRKHHLSIIMSNRDLRRSWTIFVDF